MRSIVSVLLVVVVLLAGCSNVDVYTFKKARVDQKEKGNRGYIEGTPPPSTAVRNSKRTLIGVDIDMGTDGSSGSGGQVSESSSSQVIQTKSSKGTVTTVIQEEYIK